MLKYCTVEILNPGIRITHNPTGVSVRGEDYDELMEELENKLFDLTYHDKRTD